MSDNNEEKQLSPLLLDMGKVGRKKIRAFKKEGKGELLDDIGEAIAQARAQLGPTMAAVAVLPIVLVYEKKTSKSKKRLSRLLPF